jgi:restriction system protein
MSIARFDQFIDPLLRLLAEHPEGVKTADAQRRLADEFGISEEERRQLLPSGVYPIYKNRIGWAHDRLKRDGLSSSVRRGFWRITEKGKAYARQNPQLSDQELARLARPAKSSGTGTETEPPRSATTRGGDPSALAPDERIHLALNEIRESLVQDLLQHIAAREPEFFERLVLRTLQAIGYGADERSLEHSGSPGDDGIDGVISLDRLGLDQVYVQAKRYAADRRIQKEAIHGFIGALHLKGANKGVFITTSSFSPGAKRAGEEVRGLSLRLIDGEMLAGLMIDHQVGVRHEPLPIPRLDLDFWDEE